MCLFVALFLAAGFGALRVFPRSAHGGVLVFSGADILARARSLQHFRPLSEFVFSALAWALFLALSRRWLIHSLCHFTSDSFLVLAQRLSGLTRHAPGDVARRVAYAGSRVRALPCSSCRFACDLSSHDLCLTFALPPFSSL